MAFIVSSLLVLSYENFREFLDKMCRCDGMVDVADSKSMGFGFILTILIVSSKEQTLSPKRGFRAIFREKPRLEKHKNTTNSI